MNTDTLHTNLRQVRVGVLLSLLCVLFGFGLGGLFGGAEDTLKGELAQRATAVQDTVYGGDVAQVKAIQDRAWTYFKRAHMHGGAIGSFALLGALLLASLAGLSARVRALTAAALGTGALGYSVFWLLAGLRAPGLGGTGPAKESLAWLAFPSAGLLLLGVIALIVLVVRQLFLAQPRAVSTAA
jgi:hypothetical protein